MSARDIVIDERRAAMARIASKLRYAHNALASAEAENKAHALGLDLPSSAAVLAALTATCKKAHEEFLP